MDKPEEDILFYHGKTSDGHRFTIAGQYQAMPVNDGDVDVIMMGASLCSGIDNFAKKKGRVKAEGRMRSNGLTGKAHYSLYQETMPVGWFNEKRTQVFVEAAKLNEALTRKGFMSKFHL